MTYGCQDEALRNSRTKAQIDANRATEEAAEHGATENPTPPSGEPNWLDIYTAVDAFAMQCMVSPGGDPPSPPLHALCVCGCIPVCIHMVYLRSHSFHPLFSTHDTGRHLHPRRRALL